MPNPSPRTDEVHVIREVHLNYGQDRPVQAPLTDSDAAAAFLRGVISDTTREHAVAIYLDPKNRPLGWRIVSIGTDVLAPVKPLLVLLPAVLLGANAMIFAHNHPSGDLEPSPEDKKLARDAVPGLHAAGPSASRQPHLDRARQQELRAVCAMKNLGQASLFDEPQKSKRWHSVHAAPASGTANSIVVLEKLDWSALPCREAVGKAT